MSTTSTESVTLTFEQEAVPHLPALYRTALRMTRNEQAAEDLVQDTLERAYRSFDRYEPGTNFHAWLFKILSYTAISTYRRQAARAQTTPLDGMEEFNLYHQTRRVGIEVSDVEASVLDRLGEGAVRDAIDALPPEFRLVIMLADVEGFAYKEIAQIVGIPIGTVMSRLHRSRRLLQAALCEQAYAAGIIKAEARV
jgi:RNA polymerase sigma-70 factor (ECF subfamily)